MTEGAGRQRSEPQPTEAAGRRKALDVSYALSWRQRKHGVSRLRLQEMGSRYLFIVLHVWLEKLLTRSDYRRPPGEHFEPWPLDRP